jgi:tetraprenyl-beta-curcumene synthase
MDQNEIQIGDLECSLMISFRTHHPVKLLFMGHSGSGKSTALNHLVSNLNHKIGTNFLIVKYDVLEILDSNDIDYTDILFWEFSAAAGSTLGIFILLAEANRPVLSQKDMLSVFSAYFPWICGLHILLDYLIDREEDQREGDLNFTFYYADSDEMLCRLKLFIRQAFIQADTTVHPAFTKTVINGLLAMYLSDPKAMKPETKSITADLLAECGPYAKFLHTICLLLRKCKKI